MGEREQTVVNDRGAVLVHVAFAILALVAFTTFVVDYGVLWASRRAAQNSADAAALAGAIAYNYDEPGNQTVTGAASQAAFLVSQQNLVWGQAPSVIPASDITFPPCPDNSADTCIRVDVYRNSNRGNPLPIFFGQIVGLTQQGIRATATAQLKPGNASDCLKPWAVPDKWDENNPIDRPVGVWDPADEFNRYDKDGNLIANPDIYIPPTKDDPGTGFTLEKDLGVELNLKFGDPQQAIRPGWFFPVALSDTPGGDEYRDNIAGCVGEVWGIGDWIPVEPGNMIGPTSQGVNDLIALDPDASWNTTTKSVDDSCVDDDPPSCPFLRSPRIVAIPIFDLDIYQTGRTGGRIDIKIVNILGFFIEEMTEGKDGKNVRGYLASQPALIDAGKGEVGPESAFSTVIILVR